MPNRLMPVCTGLVIFGIDPGSKSPGFARAWGQGVWSSIIHWDPTPSNYDGLTADAIVVEAQHPAKKSGKQSLITLGFSAGVLAGYYAGIWRAPIYTATARTWRGVFGRGMGGKSKEAALAVIWRDYTDLLPERPESDDEADAIAITLAYLLKPEAFTRHVQKGIPS